MGFDRPRLTNLACGALIALFTVTGLGCGYSEDEMRAKVRAVEALQKELNAEQARSKQFQTDLDEANAQAEQLKEQLAARGVDVANLRRDKDEQARALAEYQRRAAQLEAIEKRFSDLRRKLQQLTKFGLKVVVRNNKMVIQLPGDVLFDSGRETLRKQGQEILGRVASVIRSDGALAKRDFQVAGHTDGQPYRVGIFKDNWGLSVMRAREVLAMLVKPLDEKGGGLSPKRWSAAGYGATDPISSNASAQGRQANRRCELVVVPALEEMLDLKSIAR